MSALPPKADMCGALAHVRFVPIADMLISFDRARRMSVNGAAFRLVNPPTGVMCTRFGPVRISIGFIVQILALLFGESRLIGLVR